MVKSTFFSSEPVGCTIDKAVARDHRLLLDPAKEGGIACVKRAFSALIASGNSLSLIYLEISSFIFFVYKDLLVRAIFFLITILPSVDIELTDE